MSNRWNRRNNTGEIDGQLDFMDSFSGAPDTGDLTLFYTSECKTYVRSRSFSDSFISVGSLQWPHEWNKSASRLLGHPV